MATSRNNRWAHVGCLIAILALSAGTAQAWYDKVHVLIVIKAAEMLRRSEPAGWYAGLMSSSEVLRQLAAGASDEDYQPPVRGNERSFRHYYDPDAPAGQQGVKFYRHYYVWIPAESAEVTHPLLAPGRERMIDDNTPAYYDGTLAWAIQDNLGNDQNWPAAICSYRTKSPVSRLRAYYYLGRVAHLLGDMSEPDHVMNLPHPGSGYMIPRDIDKKIFTPKTVEILKELVGELGVSDSAVEEFRQAVLQHPSVANRDAIGFEGLIESLIPFRAVQGWFPEQHASRIREYRLPAGGFSLDNVWGARPAECRDIGDCFNNLARKTKRAAATSKLRLPLGLEDVGGLLSAAIQQSAGTQTVARLADAFGVPAPADWGARVAAAVYEPICIIPTIDLRDTAAAQPYVQLAGERLNDATEHVAALLKLFHDIVREPPIVGTVTLSQDGGGSYSATFGRQAGSDDRRELAIQKSNPFVTGKPVTVELSFADSYGDIDPNSVKVALAASGPQGRAGTVSTTVTGRLLPQDELRMMEDKWEGSFTPALMSGNSEAELGFVIQAKDRHAHFPRLGLAAQGYDLDSDPRTVAVVAEKSPYSWKGYEPGVDTNHRISVRAGPSQEQQAGTVKYEGTLSEEFLASLRKKYAGQGDLHSATILSIKCDPIRMEVFPENDSVIISPVVMEFVLQYHGPNYPSEPVHMRYEWSFLPGVIEDDTGMRFYVTYQAKMSSTINEQGKPLLWKDGGVRKGLFEARSSDYGKAYELREPKYRKSEYTGFLHAMFEYTTDRTFVLKPSERPRR